MKKYEIQGEVTKLTDQELLDALEWLSSNYGQEIFIGNVSGKTKTLNFRMAPEPNDWVTAVAILTALKNQFGADLTDYELRMGI